MHLEIGVDKHVADATEQQVRDAIDGLDERKDNPFIIVSCDGGGFIQAFGGPYAFLVEYRDPGEDRQFQATVRLPKDLTCSLFAAYLRGDPSYVDEVEWRDITDEIPKASRWGRAFLTASVVVVAVLVIAAIVQVLRYGINWR